MVEREQIVRALFESCLEHADRAAFLADRCPDASLRQEVETLLAAHDRASTIGSPTPITSEPARQWVGRRLGVYEIIDEIGSGGMGRVYLAFRADDAYRKRVAIKLARATLDSTELLERFRQERQILANLQHPNIVRLLDGGATADGMPYLVMDYIEGVRVDQYCAEHELPIADRLNLFRTLCAAVQFAHQNLIVHRDIKPNNILVTENGVLQLFDFGVAKLLAPEVVDHTALNTRTGMRLMTLDYASPEQVRGERVTTATDIYSLGIVLYELLTGCRPYTLANRSDSEAMRIICDEQPTKPSSMVEQRKHSLAEGHDGATGEGTRSLPRSPADPRQLSGDLDTIVLKAIRKEPHRRYGSVEQLSEDLRRYLEGLPILARKDTLGYRAGKFVKRHTAGVVAAAVIGLTLIGGMITTAWQARIAQRQRREAEAQRIKADRRFNDVRRLADSFLFEIHDAIANLAGATPARKLVVSKALEYLDGLAAEAEDDVALQQELATAYDRVADVQGGPFSANLGDVSGAVESYRKAHQIRRALYEKQPDNHSFRRGFAYSLRKMGDGAFAEGKVADAVSQYRQAAAISEELLAKDRNNFELQRDLAEATSRLCNTLLPFGDTAGTIASCRQYASLADALLRRDPSDAKLRMAIANNTALLGNALRLSRQLDEARESLRLAEAQFEAALERDSSNAVARRSLAMTRVRIASTLAEMGETGTAIASYEAAVQSLKTLVAADPKNARYRLDLMFTLLRRVGLLLQAGKRSLAVQSAKEGLALARAQAERPEASAADFNEYAHWLSNCDVPQLRNPALALHYAKRAVEASDHPNAIYLDTLAWAHHRGGNPAKAIEVLEKAMATLPPSSQAGPSVGLRGQLEHDMAEFKSALAKK